MPSLSSVQRALVLAATITTLTAGCCLSHVSSASALGDASAEEMQDAPDATLDTPDGGSEVACRGTCCDCPCAPRWLIETRAVSLEPPQCVVPVGRTAFVRATVALTSGCEHGAPATATVEPSGSGGVIRVTGRVWVEVCSACDLAVGSATRSIPLTGLAPGTWTVVDAAGMATTSFVVAEEAVDPCIGAPPGGEGATCAADCNCTTGLTCVGEVAEVACVAECHLPCSEDLDCAPAARCETVPVGVPGGSDSDVCVPRTTNACDAANPCPPGMSCMRFGADIPDQCDWSITLDSTVRHACVDEGGCSVGLHCVEHADGSRTCEVPCATPDMRCPPMHSCSPSAVVSGNWVCEWTGE